MKNTEGTEQIIPLYLAWLLAPFVAVVGLAFFLGAILVASFWGVVLIALLAPAVVLAAGAVVLVKGSSTFRASIPQWIDRQLSATTEA